MNLQVLRKKQEGNCWLRVEGKRQAMHQHDKMVQLKRELEDIQEKGFSSKQKLSMDGRRLENKLQHVVEQKRYIGRLNEDAFMKVWVTKEEEIGYFFQKLLDTKRLINENVFRTSLLSSEVPSTDRVNLVLSEHTRHCKNLDEKDENAEIKHDLKTMSAETSNTNDASEHVMLERFAADLDFLCHDNINPECEPTSLRCVSSLDLLLKNLNISHSTDMDSLKMRLFEDLSGDKSRYDGDINIAKAVKEFLATATEYVQGHPTSDPRTSVFKSSVNHHNSKEYWYQYSRTALSEKERQSLNLAFTALGKYLLALNRNCDLTTRRNNITQKNLEVTEILNSQFP